MMTHISRISVEWSDGKRQTIWIHDIEEPKRSKLLKDLEKSLKKRSVITEPKYNEER